MTQVHSTTDELHRQINLLLPWYINQSLETDERQRVEQHISHCLICRRDLNSLHKLRQVVLNSSDLTLAAETSFAALQTKMHPNSAERSEAVFESNNAKASPINNLLSQRNRRVRYFARKTWVQFAIAASLLLTVIPLGLNHWRTVISEDQFYTLSSEPTELSTLPQLRVVFAKNLSRSEMNSLLNAIKAQKVDGPNSVGAFTVTISPDASGSDIINAVKFLRKHSTVILAEPVAKP